MICSGVNRTLPIETPFSQVFSHYTWTDFRGAGQVEYYSHRRYHEAIDNVTPTDKYYGRDRVILKKREKVRQETMKIRRELNRMAMREALPNGVSQIIMRDGIRSLRNQPESPKPPDDKQRVVN
jgi:hypothetical protein